MQKIICLIILQLISFRCFATTNNALVLQQAEQFMRQNHVIGMAIELYDHGESHAYYLGYANLATQTKVTSKTAFDIGSISKVFTTLLLALEVNQQKMQLNAPVTDYYPILPKQSAINRVTLLNLATHTSGLPFNLSSRIKNKIALQAYLSQWQPSAPIGTQWAYSNLGIGVLGAAIENTTDGDYDTLYNQMILMPLNMTPIAFDLANHYKGIIAQGYSSAGDFKKDSNLDLLPASWDLKATGPDMLKFLSAVIGLPNTPKNIMAAMHLTETPFVKTALEYEGLGWEIHPLANGNYRVLLQPRGSMPIGPMPVEFIPISERIFISNALIDKTGSWDGFRTYVAAIPQTQSGVVILVNSEVSNGNMRNFGRRLLFIK